MSKPSARKSTVITSGYETSIARTAIAALLVVVGIAWIVVYVVFAQDAANYTAGLGKKPDNPLPWMADLEKWNYAIGFGLIFVGLAVSAHKSTPLGRGRGVVIGMLGCFLIGLIWIVTFYFVSGNESVPVMGDLGQYNLLVGIGFMAVGFTFATKWE
ncbi:MAG: cell division protein CrgA [Marmoricola sp.]